MANLFALRNTIPEGIGVAALSLMILDLLSATRLAIGESDSSKQRCRVKGDGYKQVAELIPNMHC